MTEGDLLRKGPPQPMVTAMPNEARRRLQEILGWLRTAKENLPAINDGAVSADRIVAASELIDRLHRSASALDVSLPDQPSGATSGSISGRRDRAA